MFVRTTLRTPASTPGAWSVPGRLRVIAAALSMGLIVAMLSALPARAADLDGVWHDPFGDDELYSAQPTERTPRGPMADQQVTVRATTWPIAAGQTVWVTWRVNGQQRQPRGAAYDYNSGNNTFWTIDLGTFDRGDRVEYTVHADVHGGNRRNVGPFAFTTTSWSSVTDVTDVIDNGTSVDLVTGDSAGDFEPRIRYAFDRTDGVSTQIAPTGAGLDLAGEANYRLNNGPSRVTITTNDLEIRIEKSPYRMSVHRRDGSLITQQYDSTQFRNIGWASDGRSTVTRIEDHFRTPSGERFEGFGQRYDRLDHRGRDVHNYVYNQYLDQGATARTYYSVPYFANSAGYGVHLDTSRYAIFNLATHRADMAGFTADTGGELDSTLTYHLYTGDQASMLDAFTADTGRPLLPPKWAFGLWGSANEWNTQADVDRWLAQVDSSQIPHSVLVLEQWSDEATFYVWKDAQYTPSTGAGALRYHDLRFPAGGAWRDPRQMVADVHDRDIKVLLWQIPVLKENFTQNPPSAPIQHVRDREHATASGYLVADRTGGPYRIPTGQWFGDSTVPDFTNPAATRWWMDKRQYLLDEIGVDGFKTDGSEALFGRDLRVHDGRRGDEMHNAYPNEYLAAYHDLVQRSTGGDGTIFSRAGTTGAQGSSIFWAGDQASTFGAFAEAVRAGQSIGQSGVPFWAWDLAGFTGPFPTAELYLRSTAQATFSPIMQYHSEKADPSPSEERTPWNVQARTGDSRVLPVFTTYANLRMNLVPYLYTEADHSARTGAPMMRAMSLAYPGDRSSSYDQQYMFGSQLLVAPITSQGQTVKDIAMPAGEWYDFFNGGRAIGASVKQYRADLDQIPVYARAGAVIPLNLNEDYALGGTIGNDVDTLTNLTFRIYPAQSSSYDYFEDSAEAHRRIEVSADRRARTVRVQAPVLTTPATYQISGTPPGTVRVAGRAVQTVSSPRALAGASSGWYHDPVQQLTHVKVPTGTSGSIELTEVDKAAYEAEFAAHIGVGTNNDHAGHTGIGFVDGFAEVGDAVEFEVLAESAGDHQIAVRYSNGAAAAAVRSIRINGGAPQRVQLPATGGWAAWRTVRVPTSLPAGRHTLRVEYSAEDSGGINLDHLVLSR